MLGIRSGRLKHRVDDFI
jgi:hypothetical protein